MVAPLDESERLMPVQGPPLQRALQPYHALALVAGPHRQVAPRAIAFKSKLPRDIVKLAPLAGIQPHVAQLPHPGQASGVGLIQGFEQLQAEARQAVGEQRGAVMRPNRHPKPARTHNGQGRVLLHIRHHQGLVPSGRGVGHRLAQCPFAFGQGIKGRVQSQGGRWHRGFALLGEEVGPPHRLLAVHHRPPHAFRHPAVGFEEGRLRRNRIHHHPHVQAHGYQPLRPAFGQQMLAGAHQHHHPVEHRQGLREDGERLPQPVTAQQPVLVLQQGLGVRAQAGQPLRPFAPGAAHRFGHCHQLVHADIGLTQIAPAIGQFHRKPDVVSTGGKEVVRPEGALGVHKGRAQLPFGGNAPRRNPAGRQQAARKFTQRHRLHALQLVFVEEVAGGLEARVVRTRDNPPSPGQRRQKVTEVRRGGRQTEKGSARGGHQGRLS